MQISGTFHPMNPSQLAGHGLNRLTLMLGLLAFLSVTPPSYADIIVMNASGTGPYKTLQEAVTAALPGDTIQLQPGIYTLPADGLLLGSKPLTLEGLGTPQEVILDSGYGNVGVLVSSDAAGDILLRRFSVTKALLSGIQLHNSYARLEELEVSDNQGFTDTNGAGIQIIGGAPELRNLQLDRNITFGDGAALYVEDAEVVLENIRARNNFAAGTGSVLMLTRASAELREARWDENETFFGSTVLATDGSLLVTQRLTMLNNQNGGFAGVEVRASQWLASNLLSAGNQGYYSGAVYCVDGNLSLSNSTLVENSSFQQAGAYTGARCNGTFTNVLFAYNRGAQAGALYLTDQDPLDEPTPKTSKNSPARTTAGELGLYSMAGCNLFENGRIAQLGLSEELINQQLSLDPGFQWAQDSLTADEDRYELLPSSPMRNAGVSDPAFNDPDGSRSDIGFTGGPEASSDSQLDTDGDGMPDFYEQWQGLDPHSNDAGIDTDEDGMLNADEYIRGTWARESDTDGDGIDDEQERQAASNPRDAFSPSSTLTLPVGRITTLQQAIDAARRGVTIRVSPGTYYGNVNTLGKALTLQGVGGEENTFLELNSEQTGTMLQVFFGEGPDTVIDGFTLQQADGEADVSSLYVSYASPTLSNLSISNTELGTYGSVALDHSAAKLSHIRFDGNVGSVGVALYVLSSQVTLEGLHFRTNTATASSIMYAEDSQLKLSDVSFDQNQADAGTLLLKNSTASVQNARFSGNITYTSGAALSAIDSTVSLEDFEAVDNLTSGNGSVLSSSGSSIVLRQGRMEGNQASGNGTLYLELGTLLTAENLLVAGNQAVRGGFISANGSQLAAHQLTIDGNRATSAGGALELVDSLALLTNTAITYNAARTGGDVAIDATSTLTLSYGSLYGNRASAEVLDGGQLSLEEVVLAVPGYVQHTDDLSATGDDFHLLSSSPLLNAGAPSSAPDPDGSPADIGYFGGPLADFDYYQDSDLDGMPDGAEEQNGLTVGAQDSAADADGDGLSNGEELSYGTLAQVEDSDGDGLTDEEELAAQSDPRSAFDPAGEVRVPEVFETIQDAIDAAPLEGNILVSSGTYKEHLNTLGKQLSLKAVGTAGTTILDGEGSGPIVRFELGEGEATLLEGFILRNGYASAGGGIYSVGSRPTLRRLEVRQCQAVLAGGGIYLDGSATLSDVILVGNRTAETGSGGGLYIASGTPTLTRIQANGNSANSGGGIYVYDGKPLFRNLLLQGNQAPLGGGFVQAGYAQARIEQATIHANSGTSGAGVLVSAGTLTMINSLVTGNIGPLGAGLGARGAGTYALQQVNVYSNHGSNVAAEVEAITEESGYLSVDPRYIHFSDDAQWDNDELHLRPDSTLKDAGAEGTLDLDGSAAELGYFGGPLTDTRYYQDIDGDGLYDGWEISYGLSTTQNSSDDDLEGDTVSNGEEFEHGLNPTVSDSDGDGIDDATELKQGSDAADFFSPNDTVVATDFFATLQDAIHAARDGVTLLVPEGRYTELLDFRGKAITLKGMGEVSKTILHGNYAGSVISFRSGESREARLEGFTITGGTAQDGGGIRVFQASPTLHRLYIYGNSAANGGGGISVSYGGPLISSSAIWSNQAQDGGGIAGRASTLELLGSTVVQNTASLSGGGVTCVDICSPTFRNNIVAFNNASLGGGVNLILPGVLVFEYNNLYGNLPDDYGAFPSQQGRKGNIGLDPLFRALSPDPLVMDLRLEPNSPSIDRGQDLSDWSDPIDLMGLSRPLDGDLDGAAAWDMGAYELERDADLDDFLPSEGDCNDSDASSYPNAPETCGDGIDQSCDGLDLSCDEVDDDGDGFTENQGDCDDGSYDVRPEAEEYEDGIDNNCDGQIDEGFETPTATPTPDAGGCACTQSPAAEPAELPLGTGLLTLLVVIGLRRRRLS